MHHPLLKILLRIEKSPVEDEDIEIIGTRPVISITLSPIGRNIEFAQSQR